MQDTNKIRPRYYSLPSGKVTVSVRRYRTAWNKLRKTAEVVFKRSTIGFDAGIAMAGNLNLTSLAAIQLWEYVNQATWKD